MHAFEPAPIGSVTLPNRLVRSATFEALCDRDGTPGNAYADFYADLAQQGLGGLITGFAFVSADGRAMQAGQAGIDADNKVPAFRRMVGAAHRHGCPVFLQIAHAGRQTVPAATGGSIYGPSTRASPYFRHRPCRLTVPHIERIVRDFGEAARRAREAGFDGVQLHAAHGYLIHQFLQPAINDRTDEYGIDPATGLGLAFLDRIITRVRSTCGSDFPLLVKVSAGERHDGAVCERRFANLIRFLDAQRLDAIEISYGTMDGALNIFRGTTIPWPAILAANPRYRTRNPVKRWLFKLVAIPWLRRQCVPFAPMYNLAAARLARQHTARPLISVGGFRSGAHIRQAIEVEGIDFVGLCRPLVREPGFARHLQRDPNHESPCANCNRCAILCDSGHATRCYGGQAAAAPHATGRTSNVELPTSNFESSEFEVRSSALDVRGSLRFMFPRQSQVEQVAHHKPTPSDRGSASRSAFELTPAPRVTDPHSDGFMSSGCGHQARPSIPGISL